MSSQNSAAHLEASAARAMRMTRHAKVPRKTRFTNVPLYPLHPLRQDNPSHSADLRVKNQEKQQQVVGAWLPGSARVHTRSNLPLSLALASGLQISRAPPEALLRASRRLVRL